MGLARMFMAGMPALGLFWAGIGELPAQQTHNWTVYRASDGLADSFTTAVSVGPKGTVWATHREVGSISTLDGYEVDRIPVEESGYSPVQEGRTGQVWSVYSDGLQRYEDGEWTRFPVQAIWEENRANVLRRVRPISIFPKRHNQVLFLLSDRLAEFHASEGTTKTIRSQEAGGVGRFFDMVEGHGETLWVTGERGLIRVTGPLRNLPDRVEWQTISIPERLAVENLQRPLPDGEGGVTLIAESKASDRRVVVYFKEGEWEMHEVGNRNVRQAWRQSDGTFWGITINSVFRLKEGRIETLEKEGALAGQYFDVATQPGDVFWIATSEGLVRASPLPWQTPEPVTETTVPVHTIEQDEKGALWFGTAEGLLRLHDGELERFPWPIEADVFFRPTDRLFRRADGGFWMTLNGEVYEFDPESEAFRRRRGDSEARFDVLGKLPDGRVVLHQQPFSRDQGEEGLVVVEEETPGSLAPLPKQWEGRNELFFFYAAGEEDYWLGSSSGLARWRGDSWEIMGDEQGYGLDGGLSFLDRGDGKLWFGGRNTIWELDGHDFELVQRGLDRINAMIETRDGGVWVAASSGLYRYQDGSWLPNGVEEGLPSRAVYEVFEDDLGTKWVGTSRGISRYHREADVDPPRVAIDFDRKTVQAASDETTTIPFGGRDKWRFTEKEHLLYSYRVDNRNWSPFRAVTAAHLSGLTAGNHRLEVRAVDRNGNISQEPAEVEFLVVLPWHQDPRLLAMSIGGAAVILFLAGLAYNRHRRLVRSYAEVERIVQQRTRELEQANQQLLHSQKMRALGTLAAGVAHDFNSMLSIIKGSAQIIERNLHDTGKIEARAGRIKTVVDQGSSLVRAMLGFSRDRGKDGSRYDLNEVVEGAVRLLGDRLTANVRIEAHSEPPLPPVYGSRELLQQILINLLINASESSRNGERAQIDIRTGRLERIPQPTLLAPRASQECLFVAVQDYGAGIPPENLSRIFEPFFTTKSLSAQRGTGLGLSMVYELAKELGVGIKVDSVVGEGTLFLLLIPVDSPRSEEELASTAGVGLNQGHPNE